MILNSSHTACQDLVSSRMQQEVVQVVTAEGDKHVLLDRGVYLEPFICQWQDHIWDDICHVGYHMTGHSH